MQVRVKFSGWPWQTIEPFWANEIDKTTGTKYGWNPLNIKGMGRFGGGWAIKFGIIVSSSFKDIVIELIIGSIRITFK